MGHKDLDMGDVMDDARRMEAQQWDELMFSLSRLPREEVERQRYYFGIQARAGSEYSAYCYRIADYVVLEQIITTLCEGCWGRTGCDMCCPPVFDEIDYSAWYGGEQGYRDGLRWSDFVDGPIGP